jgi:hypothetical protein
MVVDLSVEYHLDVAVFVPHRLGAGGREVEQGQPAVYQLASGVEMMAPSVRTPMGEQRIHPGGPLGVG